MRCERARRLMPAAIDGQLRPWRRRGLDRHLGGCGACRGDMAATRTLLGALGSLAHEVPVPARLEQDTLRRVRLLADEPPADAAWWRRFTVPALAGTAVVVLAGMLVGREQGPDRAVAPGGPAVAIRPGRPVGARQHDAPASAVARATPPSMVSQVPNEPPPALAAAPELFIDLPILRHLEKLEHFEAIQTTTVGDDVPDGSITDEERSSG